jgi:hypothetical protein
MTTVPMKRTEMTLHPWADCEDCEWDSDYSPVTRDRVKSHVRVTGHKVIIITEKRALWGPK